VLRTETPEVCRDDATDPLFTVEAELALAAPALDVVVAVNPLQVQLLTEGTKYSVVGQFRVHI
jgi:hypothetical protein